MYKSIEYVCSHPHSHLQNKHSSKLRQEIHEGTGHNNSHENIWFNFQFSLFILSCLNTNAGVKTVHSGTANPKAHLEGDGLLQDIKQELQLQQGSSLCGVGGQCQEAMLLAPGQQVLLKQPGEVLQAGCRQGQRAAAIQHQVTWGEDTSVKSWKSSSQFQSTVNQILNCKIKLSIV